MFDPVVYNALINAAHRILGNNRMQLGQQFCEGFMFDHDTRNGQQSQQNAQRFFNYVAQAAQQLNNGEANIRDDQQLFDIVGKYISTLFDAWRNQQQNRGMGGGFSGVQPLGMSGFGGGGGMGGGSGLFGGGGQRQGGLSLQQQRPQAGSHLADDNDPQLRPQQQSSAPIASEKSPLSFGTPAPMDTSTTYKPNPFDTFPTTGVEFSPVKGKQIWGEEKPKDRRIVIALREDLKTPDKKYAINSSLAIHQLILNDPMDVVRDFFSVAPDSLLGSSFLFRIGYHHLDVLDVPTEDFVAIRRKCIEAVAHDHQVILYKKIAEVLGTMQVTPYKAITSYLVQHINRALHLAARLSNNPKLFIKIGAFEDLDELLSSSFTHPFTTYPEGRLKLEKIVGAALWNALALNTAAMFIDKQIPTNAIQSSPAFPYSLEGVYPSKYAIPTSEEATAETFLQHLTENELSKRTYALSRRSVTITNILGKNVLPKIGKEPSVISDPIAALLNLCAIRYTDLDVGGNGAAGDVVPHVSEAYPSEQLEAYYAAPNQNEVNEADAYARKRQTPFPVDQTIFAVQYGKDPKEYLMAMDVLTTLDNQIGQGQVVLAKKSFPTIKTVA